MHVGICGLIFVLLFVMKIAGIAGMAAVSWWIVFLPLFIPLLLWLIGILIVLGVSKIISRLV